MRAAPVAVVVAAAAAAAGCAHRQHGGAVTPALAAADGWTVVPRVPMVRQQSRADCGPAALAMVLGRWQPPAPWPQVRAALGPVDEDAGVTAGRLRDAARGRGLQAFIVEGTFDDLAREVKLGRPVIVGVLRVVGRRGFPHYEVVVGVNQKRGRILTGDPAAGWREQPLDDFDERWQAASRLALVVLPAETTAQASPGN